ncbi:type II toxin-antitoxin system antitoxin, RelB/DinJ family [Clostridium sp. BIOML-A1]|nr:type II toxin-antitoxin system antitoxin, RelB/DinJ family [Clostridium sp. BIOML-A1]
MIQPDIKESAETILEKLGIPVSVFIDMTYRQVIARNGVPFELKIEKTIDSRDSVSDEDFNTVMAKGLAPEAADRLLDKQF